MSSHAIFLNKLIFTIIGSILATHNHLVSQDLLSKTYRRMAVCDIHKTKKKWLVFALFTRPMSAPLVIGLTLNVR